MFYRKFYFLKERERGRERERERESESERETETETETEKERERELGTTIFALNNISKRKHDVSKVGFISYDYVQNKCS